MRSRVTFIFLQLEVQRNRLLPKLDDFDTVRVDDLKEVLQLQKFVGLQRILLQNQYLSLQMLLTISRPVVHGAGVRIPLKIP